jgi:[protein-PII] uridylyltransferase
VSSEGRAHRARVADGLCRSAFFAALADEAQPPALTVGPTNSGPTNSGLALVAVGGFGRRELAPYSDLDVILLHVPEHNPSEIAARLWYPLWDSGFKIDHSVRGLDELENAAAADIRVALGMLDARHIAGDENLTLQLRTRMFADWRKAARQRLPELRELTQSRHERAGELAHLSIPDLKDSEGGLRDAGVMKALVATWLVDVPHNDLERCRRALLDVRDAVHRHAGRGVDRIMPEVWPSLARKLGYADALSAQRRIRELGRRMTHLSRLTWRRVDQVIAKRSVTQARRPEIVALEGGVVIAGGEVGLAKHTRADHDPTLLLRSAALAAERGLVLSPMTAARLRKEVPPLPEPWPREARRLMVRLLAAGPPLLPVWETLEEVGAVDLILPEWERIRLFPHASQIHRFTVDRHSIETCIEAARLIRQSARPDVLVMASLLHDIGKGGDGEHSEIGEPIARSVAERMGFVPDKVAQIGSLVRWHLLLMQQATTRDPDDPATVGVIRQFIHTPEDLELLLALTEADARAASSAAWSSWRERLVRRLANNVMAELSGTQWQFRTPQVSAVPKETGQLEVAELATSGPGTQILLTAPDRVGLLADVAGALLLSRHSVQEARIWEQDGVGYSLWDLSNGEINSALLTRQFSAIGSQEIDVSSRIPRPTHGALAAAVRAVPTVPPSATIIEVRAQDQLGVVYLVCRALARLGLSIRSAHVDTVGPQAVDVFYVTGPDSQALDSELSDQAVTAITSILGDSGAAAS